MQLPPYPAHLSLAHPPDIPPPCLAPPLQAVFFKMRVAGVLHIFQFETKQGEDICMALQTHINDIMMKRYSKAKAAQEGGGDAGGEARGCRAVQGATCAARGRTGP